MHLDQTARGFRRCRGQRHAWSGIEEADGLDRALIIRDRLLALIGGGMRHPAPAVDGRRKTTVSLPPRLGRPPEASEFVTRGPAGLTSRLFMMAKATVPAASTPATSLSANTPCVSTALSAIAGRRSASAIIGRRSVSGMAGRAGAVRSRPGGARAAVLPERRPYSYRRPSRCRKHTRMTHHSNRL